MDFSPSISGVVASAVSPDSLLIAVTNGSKIMVKDARSLEQVQIYASDEPVSELMFSPNSKYLLLIKQKVGIVEARSIEDEDWYAKISEPATGIQGCQWSHDSNFIFAFSDFQVLFSNSFR